LLQLLSMIALVVGIGVVPFVVFADLQVGNLLPCSVLPCAVTHYSERDRQNNDILESAAIIRSCRAYSS
jgi:hypothetical protein